MREGVQRLRRSPETPRLGGVCQVCMIDNTSVIVLRGTGALMVPVVGMAT
jgi:hypothetical protein